MVCMLSWVCLTEISCRVFSNISLSRDDRVAVILAFKVTTSGTGILYTLSLVLPNREKSRGVMPDECVGHCVEPSLPIQWLGKVTFNKLQTIKLQCGDVPSCWNYWIEMQHIQVYICWYGGIKQKKKKRPSKRVVH